AKLGRWDPTCATWVQGDTNMASGEALCRQLLTSREYMMAKFGRWTQMAWLPDNFGHAWTVPTIFADAGIKWYYFARCGPSFPLFWWEGPDGSRLAAYHYGGYSWHIDSGVTRIPLDVRRKVGVRSAMIAYGVGDHGGGPTRRDIENALRLQQEAVAPRIKFSRTDEFFKDVLSQPQARDLPVVRRELNFTFRGCYTTHSDMKRRNRQLENLLPTAESAATAAHVLLGRDYAGDDFMEAWRNVCFNQFHDLLPGSAIHDSYKFCHQLYDKAEQTARRQLQASLEALAGAADTSGPGRPVLVWNRLGWQRRGVVTVRVPNPPKGSLVAVGPSGEKVPTTADFRSKDGSAQVRFLATVPACGWAVWHLVPGMPPAPAVKASSTQDEVVLENEALRVVVDRNCGALKSIYDKAHKRQLVHAGDRPGTLQILHEDPHGMSAWNIGPISSTTDLNTPEEVTLEKEGPADWPRVRIVHTWHNSRFLQYVSLPPDVPRVDFELQADWQEKGNDTDGGPFLKVAFPLRLRSPVFTCEIPFGTVERTVDGQDVPAEKWVDLTATRVVRKHGTRSVPVDLTSYFNQDVFATADKPDDGDFDSDGVSYGAEIFRGAQNGLLEWKGIPWRVPPTRPGTKNAVACQGQTIKLPSVPASSLLLFGASAPGQHGGTGWLVFTDRSRQTLDITFSDWCFGPLPEETIVARLPYRYRAGEGRTTPETRIFARSYPIPEGKRPAALVLPDSPRTRLFAVTLGPQILRQPLYGVALLNDCKYGHDARGGTVRLSLLRASYNPDPEPDVGRHVIHYSLLLHEGDWRGAPVLAEACDLNNPLPALLTAAHQGKLPSAGSLVAIEPADTATRKAGPDDPVLTVLKAADEGEGIIVRLYESKGRAVTCWLKTGFDLAGAELTNVVEAARRGRLAVRDRRRVRVSVRPHGITTVRLLPAR
ncbi:MAG: hypothetical protein J7M26_02675, partial [Armatimonadetes bacterium]|nr:hypothetical protein [Armatimonadota bacterium]